MENELELIEDQVLDIDGKSFVRKHVKGCILVYSGGTPPIMRNSNFESNVFRLEGAAKNTADFLAGLAGSGGEAPRLVAELLGVPFEIFSSPDKKGGS